MLSLFGGGKCGRDVTQVAEVVVGDAAAVPILIVKPHVVRAGLPPPESFLGDVASKRTRGRWPGRATGDAASRYSLSGARIKLLVPPREQ
ncbi:hypothetical protein B296_00043858, partial [Ensete ventricosum]